MVEVSFNEYGRSKLIAGSSKAQDFSLEERKTWLLGLSSH
jgi:hypothetical protein